MRYLMLEDIGDGLVGRHAELFWPDDNLWYLIEIQVGRGFGLGQGVWTIPVRNRRHEKGGCYHVGYR